MVVPPVVQPLTRASIQPLANSTPIRPVQQARSSMQESPRYQPYPITSTRIIPLEVTLPTNRPAQASARVATSSRAPVASASQAPVAMANKDLYQNVLREVQNIGKPTTSKAAKKSYGV